ELTLAVVTQAPRFEYAGQPQPAGGLNQLPLAVDRRVRGHGDAQFGKQRFLREAVLGDFQRRARRPDLREFLERRERLATDVLPVEGDHVAAAGQRRELLRVLQIAGEDGCDLSARRRGAAIEK